MAALGFHLELVLGRDGRQHLDQLAGVGGRELVDCNLGLVAARVAVTEFPRGQRCNQVRQFDLVIAVAVSYEQLEFHRASSVVAGAGAFRAAMSFARASMEDSWAIMCSSIRITRSPMNPASPMDLRHGSHSSIPLAQSSLQTQNSLGSPDG